MYNIEVRHRFRVYDRLLDSYSPYFSKREDALNFAAELIRLDPRYRHRVNPADLIFDGSGVSKYRFKRYEIRVATERFPLRLVSTGVYSVQGETA